MSFQSPALLSYKPVTVGRTLARDYSRSGLALGLGENHDICVSDAEFLGARDLGGGGGCSFSLSGLFLLRVF